MALMHCHEKRRPQFRGRASKVFAAHCGSCRLVLSALAFGWGNVGLCDTRVVSASWRLRAARGSCGFAGELRHRDYAGDALPLLLARPLYRHWRSGGFGLAFLGHGLLHAIRTVPLAALGLSLRPARGDLIGAKPGVTARNAPRPLAGYNPSAALSGPGGSVHGQCGSLEKQPFGGAGA